MNELSLNNLIILTIMLSISSIYFIKKRTKKLITAATGYWFAWGFVLISTKIAVSSNWINEIDSYTLSYITILHLGAFVGFLFGTFILPKSKRDYNQGKFLSNAINITNKFTNSILIYLFILGSIFFYQRLQRVGFSADYLTNVRDLYLDQNRPFIEWLAGHLGVLVGFIIIMVGVKDGENGVNIKQLIKVIVAAAPLGLANGSRIFLLYYFIYYLASLLLYRSSKNNLSKLLSKKESYQILILLSSSLLIFSLLGFLRAGYGTAYDFSFTILGWPVSSISALSSWINAALNEPSTNGIFIFGWISNLLDKIGIINYSNEYKNVQNIVAHFQQTGNPAAYIPKTIIPELIFDFGKNGVFWGMFFISFFLQIVTLKFAAKGILLHTIAVVSIVGAFMTIQTSLFSPAFFATIIWGTVFEFLSRGRKIGVKGT